MPTNVRLVDGQELQIFSQGNSKVSLLRTESDRFSILFGNDPSSATEVFSVSDQDNDIILSAGTDLFFESNATIGGVTGSTLNIGKTGDTINLNIPNVTYNVGNMSGNLTLDGQLSLNGVIKFDGTPTTTSQNLGIEWTAFDKEGTTDFSDTAHIKHVVNSGGLSGSVLEIKSMNDTNDGINFVTNGNNNVRINGNVIWNQGNDGSGSGLDADLLDGLHASSFLRSDQDDTLSGKITVTGLLRLQGQHDNADGSDRSGYWQYDGNVALTLEPTSDNGAVAILFPSYGNKPSDFAYIVYDEDYLDNGEGGALILGAENDGTGSSDHVRVKSRFVIEADMSSYDPTNAFTIEQSKNGTVLMNVQRDGNKQYIKAGTYNVIFEGRNTWDADGSTIYPTIHGSHQDEWVMLHFPHVPYLENGKGGYNGVTFGQRVRFAANANTPTYWDQGIQSSIGSDKFSISRGGSSTQFLQIDSSGKVGIGKNSPSKTLDVSGDIQQSGQIISTVSTGTAPLAVSSTTTVSNLSADMVDGVHQSSLVRNDTTTTISHIGPWFKYTGTSEVILAEHTNGGPVPFQLRKTGDTGTSDSYGILHLDRGKSENGQGSNLYFRLLNGSSYEEFGGIGQKKVDDNNGELQFLVRTGGTSRVKVGYFNKDKYLVLEKGMLIDNSQPYLRVWNTNSGTQDFYFGESSSNGYGLHLYWDSGYTTYWKSRHAGTDTNVFHIDTRSPDLIMDRQIQTNTGSSGGIKIGNSILSSVDGNELVIYKTDQIRISDSTSWDYNQWAGIKYESSTRKMYIGGPQSSKFDSNTNPQTMQALVLDQVDQLEAQNTDATFKSVTVGSFQIQADAESIDFVYMG